MEQQRFRRVPDGCHEDFSLRGGASEMLISSSVDNPFQCYQPSDPLYPQVVFHPQSPTNYTQLMDYESPSMVTKLDEIERERHIRTNDEVCRLDPVQFYDQARFSAQNSPVCFLPDVESLMHEIPNGIPSSESDNKPVHRSRTKHPKRKKTNGTVPRFRPTDEQKRLLENHFNSGSTHIQYTK